jgi:hypothetical protein
VGWRSVKQISSAVNPAPEHQSGIWVDTNLHLIGSALDHWCIRRQLRMLERRAGPHSQWG